MMARTRVYLNSRFLGQPLTGVQRVASELTSALKLIRGEDMELLAPPNVTTDAHSARNVGRTGGHLWEQFELPRYSRDGLLLNLCNTAPLRHPKQIILIHDTGALRLTEGYSWRFRAWYGFMQRHLVKSGVSIATVSEFSKREILDRLGARPEQVRVIRNGADHMNRIVADHTVIMKNGLASQRFVLAVGSLAPHKNLQALAHLADKLVARGMSLVITGGFSSAVFQSADLPKSARYIGRVNDAQLKALYGNADCFVCPSRYEGFGLPSVEAMTCGCPVVASGIDALREVCGDAAVYAQADTPSDFTDKVMSVIDDEALTGRLRTMGVARAAEFTWFEAAQRLNQMITHLQSGVTDQQVR